MSDYIMYAKRAFLLKLLFFSQLAFAEPVTQQNTSPEKSPAFLNSIELDYRLFSPEVLFHLGNDIVDSNATT